MGRLGSALLLCFALVNILSLVSADWHRHDATFTPDIILRATAQNISVNCESRYSVVINGTSPGPQIHLQEGRTTWIRVYNDIPNENLTIHWHGLTQRTAPFSDGSPLVSQWPIASGYFFDYEVHPDVGDAGTYFYHSHVGFQAVSAHGVLIVDECDEPPYEYDADLVILLADYYNRTDKNIVDGLLANPFRWSGEPNAVLFNDKSGKADWNNASDESCQPLVIEVEPDTTYRWRWIGGTAISFVSIGIEGHENLTIIEADGHYSKPVHTDHLQIASGQRFSLLFETKSMQVLEQLNRTSFWIRYESRERPTNVTGYALLKYKVSGAQLPASLPDKSPVTLPAKTYDWLEYTFEPLNASSDPFPRESTRTVVITVNQVGIYTNGTFVSAVQWEQNDAIWQETARDGPPYLVSVYENGQSAIPDYNAALANGGWDPSSLVFPAKIGEILDIVWESNTGPTGGWDFHPFHAHGGHYWDIGSGNGTYDAAANARKLEGYEPMKRDTTMLYRYATRGVSHTTAGWRAWRIKVEYAGSWMLHCHILQHMIMGMQTVWSFGDAADILAIDPQPYISGYLTYGGSAYGNDSYDPMVNHYFADGGDMYVCNNRHIGKIC